MKGDITMSDMPEKKTRAKRSTKEQMIAKLEDKIRDHEKAIQVLRDRIDEMKKPKPSIKQYNDLVKKAKNQGLTLEQIAEKLGIDL